MPHFILSAFGDEIAPDLQQQMKVLKKQEISYIEIRGVNGRGIVEYSLRAVENIKRQLDKNNFKISAVGSPLGKIDITDDFTPHFNLFKHTLKIADILETEYIRMFSFFIPEGEEPDKYRSQVITRWEEFLKEASGKGITLLHENEKDIYGDTPERCLDLLDTLKCDYFKAIFDPANFVQCDVDTYPEAFQILEEYIEYLHIKDALYSNYRVVPAGRGDGNLLDILQALADKDFEGFLSLEPHLGSFAGLADLERDSAVEDLQESNKDKFSLAANALKKLLGKIEY